MPIGCQEIAKGGISSKNELKSDVNIKLKSFSSIEVDFRTRDCSSENETGLNMLVIFNFYAIF